MATVLLLLAAVLLATPTALAQQPIKVNTSGVQPSRVKLGGEATIQITVKGTQEATLAPIPGVPGLRLTPVGPSQRSFISFVNGVRTSEVSLTWQIRVTPLRKGSFTIPSIRLRAGGQEWHTQPETLEVVEDFRGQEHGRLTVTASQKVAWLHQPVRITATLELDRAMVDQGRIRGLALRLPWVDKLEGASPLAAPAPGGKALRLTVNDKPQAFRQEDDVERRGRRWLRVTFSRDYLPTATGTLDLPAGFMSFGLVTRFTRSVFGERVPAETTSCTVPGQPLTIEVRPFPEEGRPADYTGAVGRFTVSATAAPTNVQVGESIKLTLAIQGQGNLGFFTTPELGELPGFRVFGKTEERVEDVLKVVYDLAPVEETVAAVPALAFSYFDTTPEREGYRTVRTRPIRIRVRPLPEGAGLKELTGPKRTLVPGVDDIVGLRPLDRAAATVDPDRVDRVVLAVGLALPPLLYGLLLLVLHRRRARLADPVGQRRRRALGAFRAALGAATTTPDLDRAFYTLLADLWGSRAAAMRGGGWRDPATAAGLDSQTLARLAVLEDHLDRERFAPGGEAAATGLREEMVSLALELEQGGGGR